MTRLNFSYANIVKLNYAGLFIVKSIIALIC